MMKHILSLLFILQYPSNSIEDFQIIGPSNCKEDEAVVFTVKSNSPEILKFQIGIAKDELIDLYSIGNMRVASKCIDNGFLDDGVFNESESKSTKYMGEMNLENVVNCGNAEDETFLFEFAIYVMKNAIKKSKVLEFCVGVESESSVAVKCPKLNIMERENHPEKSISDIHVYLVNEEEKKIEIPLKGVALVKYGINFGDGQGFFPTKLEINVANNSGLSICKVILIKKGFNLPYIPKFQSMETKLTIDLGRIHVTDQVKNKSASEMVIQVGFQSVGIVDTIANVGIVGKTIDIPKIISINSSSTCDVEITPFEFFQSNSIVKSGETKTDWEFTFPTGFCCQPFELSKVTFGNHIGRICKLELKNTNFQCLNKLHENGKAILSLDNFCILNENKIVLSIVGELQSFKFGEKYKMFVEFLIGNKKYLYNSKSLDLSVKDDVILNEDYPPTAQAFPQWNNAVPLNSSSLILIQIKFQPASRGIYKLIVTSMLSGLSICKLSFLHIGQNLPCFNPDVFPGQSDPNVTSWINYQTHSDDQSNGNSLVELNFGSLANVGQDELVYNNRSDDNTILVAVGFKINSLINEPYELKYKFTYNHYAIENVVEIATNDDKTESEEINFSIGTNPVIFVNVTKILTVHVEISPHFYAPIIIKVESDIANIFCCAALTYVGINLPCLNASAVKIDILAKRIIFDLGHICHAKSTFTEPKSNLIKVETAILINEKIVIPSEINIKTKVNKIEKLTNFKLKKDKYKEKRALKLKLILVKDKIEMTSGIKQWISFNIKTTLFTTTQVELEIQAPVIDNRAIVTIYDFRVIRAGLNVNCSTKMIYNVQLNCKNGMKTQQDQMLVTMDYLTNTGFSRGVGNYKTSDDILTVGVLIRATDHPAIQTNFKYQMNITLNNSSSIIQLVSIKKNENGNEKINMMTTNALYDNGENVAFNLHLKHENDSVKEPHKVTITLFMPSFIKITKFSSNSMNVHPRTEMKKYPVYEISDFLFDDVTDIAIEVQIRAELRKFSTSTSEVRIVVRVLCNSNLCANIANIKLKLKPNICNKQLLLDQCQISASPSIEILADSLLIQGSRNDNKWFQVNFGNQTVISQIEIHQIHPVKQKITKYLLFNSFDGRSWTEIQNKESNPSIVIITRFLRLSLNNEESDVKLEIRFNGCAISGDEIICNKSAVNNNINRHYAIDEAHDIMYLCDIVSNKNILTCFCSYDKGNNWKGLPDYIKSIKGYNSKLKTIIAADESGNSLLKSQNCNEWMPIFKTDIDNLKKSITVPSFNTNLSLSELI